MLEIRPGQRKNPTCAALAESCCGYISHIIFNFSPMLVNYFIIMGRSRSLTRLGSLLQRAALQASEARAANSTSAMADATSYVAKRSFSNAAFRSNGLGGQYQTTITIL
jgi:hypothetical protein